MMPGRLIGALNVRRVVNFSVLHAVNVAVATHKPRSAPPNAAALLLTIDLPPHLGSTTQDGRSERGASRGRRGKTQAGSFGPGGSGRKVDRVLWTRRTSSASARRCGRQRASLREDLHVLQDGHERRAPLLLVLL